MRFKAVSQLLWPDKDREEWSRHAGTTKRSLASIHTNCETTVDPSKGLAKVHSK